jgi:hypothetical protein
MRKLGVYTLTALAVAWTAVFAAYGAELTAAGPFRLSGVSDGKNAVTLTTLVNVTSTVAIDPLVADPTHLKGPDTVMIDRSKVTLTSAVKFAAGDNLPVGIAVAGLVKPGTYTGSVLLRDTKSAFAVTVPIEVVVLPKPVLKVAPDGLNSLTCYLEWSCSLGERWLGAKRTINVTNEGSGPATVTEKHVVLRAMHGETVLDDQSLLPAASTEEIRNLATITLTLPHALPADRYQGYVWLVAKNADAAAPTAIALDVRHGPWVALVVLALGIMLGRSIQSTQTPEALARQRLMTTLVGLQSAEHDVRDARLAMLLGQKLEDARQKIAALTQAADEAQIAAELTNISTAIDLAKSVERLDGEAAGLDDATRQQVEQHLQNARSLLSADNFTDAEKERAAAQGLVFGAPAQVAAAASSTTPALHLTFLKPPRKNRPKKLRMLQAFAGSEKTGDDVKGAYTKPLLFGLLFLGLLIVGLYALYVKNPTFGADIVYDYFSLIAWGLSADVAQRTLQNLQLSK